jgi:DNA-binding IclR family transcriptional regulator
VAEVAGTGGSAAKTWTFLTNHAHVLLCLAAEPDARLRDVAGAVGITERAVQHIVADLAAAGVVERRREGRRNRYTVHPEAPLRHPIEAHRHVADLVALAPRALSVATAGRAAAAAGPAAAAPPRRATPARPARGAA